MKASSGNAPLLVMSVNTAAKPTFFPVLFDPSVELSLLLFFYVSESAAFSVIPCMYLSFNAQ